MNTFLKTTVLSAVFVMLMIADVNYTPSSKTLKVGWFPEANAIAGTRRRTRRRTAVVVHSADEANNAQQQQAAAAATPAPAAAPAPAPAAAPPLNTGAPLAIGTVTSTLPAGCTAAPSGGVEYQKCGSDYYRTAFQGNNLVYVTAQP